MDRRELLAAGITMAAAAATGTAQNAAPPAAAPPAVATKGEILTRKIPSSGEALPVIGLGTSGPFEVGNAANERAPLQSVLEAFFANGGRLIDTSPMYSTAEAVLGDLFTPEMHQKMFLATKVWTRGAKEGVEQMTRSAQLMKHPKLDLIQVHNLLDVDTHLKTLHKWKDEGRVRYIGITHYIVSAHADLERIITKEKIDFVQLNYSAITRSAEKKLLPLAVDRGVAVLVNRPYEDGAVFDKTRDKPLPAWAADIDCTSWGQLLLKYIVSNPAVTCVIPATSKVKHVLDNLDSGRGRMPDARQRQQIVQAIAAL